MNESKRTEFRIKVRDPLGIHQRPAAEIFRFVSGFPNKIHFRRGAMYIDAKSIMGIMMLAAEKGAFIDIIVEGEGSDSVASELKKFFVLELPGREALDAMKSALSDTKITHPVKAAKYVTRCGGSYLEQWICETSSEVVFKDIVSEIMFPFEGEEREVFLKELSNSLDKIARADDRERRGE